MSSLEFLGGFWSDDDDDDYPPPLSPPLPSPPIPKYILSATYQGYPYLYLDAMEMRWQLERVLEAVEMATR